MSTPNYLRIRARALVLTRGGPFDKVKIGLPMEKVSVDLLIFDLDGTLIDAREDIATSVNLTLVELGLPPKPPEVIYGYVGEGVRRLLRQSVEGHGEELFQRSLSVFRGYYLAHLLDHTRFYPGMDEVLDYFSQKKKAVVTNKPIEYAAKILEGLKALDRFALVVGGEELSNLKPHPEMINRVLWELKVKPEKAVMIGDGVHDITAAKGAGILSCAVGYGLGKRDELKKASPDFFCEGVDQFKKMFC